MHSSAHSSFAGVGLAVLGDGQGTVPRGTTHCIGCPVTWESRLGRLGVPAAAVRTLPEALAAAQDVIVRAGHYRLVASPVHVVGYHPDYRPPPRLGEHGAPD